MFSHHLKVVTALALIALITSGCASTQLKEENAGLKQQVAQLEQTRQEYADQIRDIEKMSEDEKAQMRDEMASMRSEMESALEENKVLVLKLDDLTIIEIGNAALFASGDADLSAEGKEIVDKISKAFSKHPDYHLRIEGYTDDVPLNKETKKRFMSNWELSAARAGSVVRYMIYGLNISPESLSIAGYASYRPVADNSTPEGRSKNRRIRAVVFKNIN